MLKGLDWNLLNSFVAAAEHGTISAASRELGVSQPTLGRHIAKLEDAVGASLFARHAHGISLTDRGAALYEAARQVREGVLEFTREAEGLGEAPRGTVRISASVVMATWVLPRLVARLRREHPALEIEVVADDGRSGRRAGTRRGASRDRRGAPASLGARGPRRPVAAPPGWASRSSRSGPSCLPCTP